MPLLHASMYAVTVLGVCWLRQPIYGALAGLFTYGFVTTIIGTIPGAGEFEAITVYNGLFHDERSGVLNLWDHNYPVVYGTLAGLTLVAAILAVTNICFLPSIMPAALGYIDFAPNDGLNVALAGLVKEICGRKEIAMIRDSHSRHLLARRFIQ